MTSATRPRVRIAVANYPLLPPRLSDPRRLVELAVARDDEQRATTGFPVTPPEGMVCSLEALTQSVTVSG